MLPKLQRNHQGTDPSPRCLERHRVLREADEIGSVTEVCQRAGITRPTFYLWKKRYAASGLLGLEDRPCRPSPGRPPKATAAVRLALIEHVRKDPQAGCLSLAKRLTELGVRISSPTVQKYLNRWGLGFQQARKEWVRRGCPPVETSCPLPDPDLPGLISYESAKSYYFFGIPRRDGGGREILCPSIEEVALALGVLPAGIRVIADREHWIERRERLLFQIRASEAEEGIHRTLAVLDSTTITNAALGLKKVMDIVMGQSGEVTPLKNLMAVKALKQFYKLFKLPFGKSLPVLFGLTRSGEYIELEDRLLTGPGARGRNRQLSQASISLAKRAFFLGIHAEGQASLNLKPSVRQVAEFLALPARPLQRLAVQQHWVDARRDSDRWGGNFRAERVAHQVGRKTLVDLMWRFYQVTLALARQTSRLWEVYPNMPSSDVLLVGRSTSIYLALHNEVVRDFGTLTGYVNEVKPREEERTQARPSEIGGGVANPGSSSWQGILYRAIASTPVARQGVRPVPPGPGLEAGGPSETQTDPELGDFQSRAAYWMKRWPHK